MRTPARALLPLCVALLACGTDPAPTATAARVRIQASGAVPATYTVVLAPSSGAVQTIACPDGSPTAALTCDPQGVTVRGGASASLLTVKATGLSSQTRKLGDITGAGLVLEPLPPFVQNEHYATGFAADQRTRFEQMAHTAVTELGPSLSVKFYLRKLDTTPEVYFQDTKKYPLHYAFAWKVLNFQGSLTAFEAATYHGADRTAMAGTLVLYPKVHAGSGQRTFDAPMALTFFPSDDLTPTQAARAHRLIEERIGFLSVHGPADRLTYLPAGEVQEQQLTANPKPLDQQGSAWLTRQALYGGLTVQILNPGLAFGTLRRLSPEDLQTTVVSFTDVLVLTRLPNELPIVGGTITEELQTPLAHVNVAARTRGTPNLAYLDAGKDLKITGLLNKLVRFEVQDGGWDLREATLTEANAFWDAQKKPPFTPPSDDARKDLPAFADLGFGDAQTVGVKAANLAELKHLLKDKSPDGFAIPFGWFRAFTLATQVTPAACQAARVRCAGTGRPAQVCDAAKALCQPPQGSETLQAHAERLMQNEAFRTDAVLRDAALLGLRNHFEQAPVDPVFEQALAERVLAVVGDVDLRLRSSTNAEDLAGFSGAGLYTSVAANASGSKSAAKRVRQVWASVWSWRAFEERSFWNIDHLAMRMGVAVTPAFADEQANGVLITQNLADPGVAGLYVNVQKGEVPVTNPEGGATPEIFSILPAPAGLQVARQCYSSLSPDTPLLSTAELGALFLAAMKVQDHFAPLYGQSPAAMALDIEFKFHGPQRALLIKQVRPYGGSGPEVSP
jgi:hypothetical protein